jgi:hypothetical protein
MKYLIILLPFILTSCANLRTVGNSETHYLEPAECSDIGVVKRDGACYKRIIISSKSDAHVKINKDNLKIEIDNSGHPSFAHDLATTVQAIAIQKAMDDD